MRKWILPLLFIALIGTTLSAQYARNSIVLYQFNALSINPAYAGSAGIGTLDMTYFGNIGDFNILFRSFQFSMHAPVWSNERMGWGTIFQFTKEGAAGELSFRPSYSYGVDTEHGRLALGGTLGVNYFDFDERLIANPARELKSFLSLDGGLGVYFQADNFFAGLSSQKLFEVDFLDEANDGLQNLPRENPYYLHGGFITRLSERFQLKPVLLLKYSNNYILPANAPDEDFPNETAADLQLTLLIQEDYWVSVFYGFSKFDSIENLNRFGLSLHFLVGNLRITYGLQRNSFSESFLELPANHLFSIGYDFWSEDEENLYRIF